MKNELNKTNIEASTVAVGTRVRMSAPNSNWNVGEVGTVTWVGTDRVAIAFDGREDDYTVLNGDFQKLA
jgi:hypothetical protein